MTEAYPSTLTDLLAGLFDPPELERIVAELQPGAQGPAHDPAHDLLFGRLLIERPRHCDAIAAVYEATTGRRLAGSRFAERVGPGATERHPAMSDALVEGLDRCAGHCAATGWADLPTTAVFQVYRWAHPWLIAALPPGALREVEPEYSGQTRSFFRAGLLLSGCVGRSLHGLCANAPADTQVTFHDLFFDLARFGAGRSVQRLRDHGVGQSELRRYATLLGMGRLSRHGPIDRLG